MTGLVRKATLLTAAGLLIASAAVANVPDATLSIKPACISLTGSLAGSADPVGAFTVVVNDFSGNPINNASVVIDFSNCNDIQICDDQLDGAALVNCAGKTVRKFTDIAGSVTFTLIGGSNGAGNASTLLNGGRIFANGTLIGSPTVTAFDLNGLSGVGATDLAAWLTDFGSGQPYGRSDYDCSSAVGATDLSVWLTTFGTGNSAASCATACP